MTELIAYKSWLTYSPFIKMMVVVDMYLNEFATHPFSLIRLGTIVTRFKDCSMLVACNYVAETLGMTFPELAQWIWTSTCAKQYYRVLLRGQEVEEPRSYAMYFMELGLSAKSPYLAVLNKDLHLFVHTVGVSLGARRLINARIIGTPDLTNLLINALISSAVVQAVAAFTKQYNTAPPPSAPAELPEGIDEIMVELGVVGERPQNRNETEWLEYIMQ